MPKRGGEVKKNLCPITIFSIGIRSLKIDQNELDYKYEQRIVIPIQIVKVLIFKVIYQNLGERYYTM